LNQHIRRILNLAMAFAAVAAAVAVVVVAAAFALYAAVEPYVGEAWAAAAVARAYAQVAVIVARLATRKAAPKDGARASGESVVDRLIVMAKERPLIALGATAAAVTVLLRNPAIITAVVSAFVAGKATKSGK
jgi:hypothetical protein